MAKPTLPEGYAITRIDTAPPVVHKGGGHSPLVARLKRELEASKEQASAQIEIIKKKSKDFAGKLKAKAEAQGGRAIRFVSGTATGSALGYVRGRYPDKADPLKIPIEGATALAGGAALLAMVATGEDSGMAGDVVEGIALAGTITTGYKAMGERGSKAKADADAKAKK